ncbi:uncharacterized protein PRCAT00002340001 [Priceomyces carsonii]|uniref:uncharacterized protein n=1 Tax=Priceomyces carsonii TaxID=28549 RepID=UPI002ED83ADF|nr:unnamed protein product [Priceomyces carsonii]
MLSFRTTGYNGYGIQYSPFFDNKIAVSTAANYGLVGNGKLFILNIEQDGSIVNQIAWETQDCLFDLAWSEIHENQVSACSGDGSIKLFDLAVPQFPVMNWHEHTREVFSVNWNQVDKSMFASSSWDGTIKIWSPQRPESLLTLSSSTDPSVRVMSPQNIPPKSHQMKHQSQQPGQSDTINCIYNATFSPHSPSVILSVSGSSNIQIWDIRAPVPLQQEFVAHRGLESLGCDWNKYRSTVVASAGTDKAVRVWDLRQIKTQSQNSTIPGPAYHLRGPTPLNELLGHEYAVRKVQWSPHSGKELMSTSYDMTSKIWVDDSGERTRFHNHGGCRGTMRLHKEFVIGCDYSLWGEPGWAATTGWDEMVYIWDSKRVH